MALLPIEDQFRRDFYLAMCRVERWLVRARHKKIGGMQFERTALK